MNHGATEFLTGAYAFDPIHSSFGFAVRFNNILTFRGTFADWNATITDGTLSGSVDVTSLVVDHAI